MKVTTIKLSDDLFVRLKQEKADTGKAQELIVQEALAAKFYGVPRETVDDGTVITLNPENMAWVRGVCLKEGKTLNNIVNEIVEQGRAI